MELDAEGKMRQSTVQSSERRSPRCKRREEAKQKIDALKSSETFQSAKDAYAGNKSTSALGEELIYGVVAFEKNLLTWISNIKR